MELSVSTFLDTVERSGLVEKSQLARSLAELEREAGADAVNDSLIVSAHLGRVGLITEWQRKRLLEGRPSGYFLGKYRLLDHLGTGGMSSVFLAEHPLMRRRVAIKVLPRNRVHDSSYLARFHREARAVASLDHPNIVRAFDVDNEDDVHYLVMEYIEGHDLKSLVERDGPLPYRTAADFMRQAADGLAHAHQAGLIHRDVKPANLLVDAKQVVKLLDMGLARTSDEVDASLTKDHDERMLGTVDYLAPEQALDSHLVDPRADIYSLGCTLYFALTGRPPFAEGTLAQRVLMHQSKEPPDIVATRPDVPPGLVAICRRMMAKSPAARYQSGVEVSQALADWIKRYDAGEADAGTFSKQGSDEELALAPLDDEPPRGGLASSRPAASSAAEASATVKSDKTKVDRAAKPNPSLSGKSAAGKGPGSSIKASPPKAPAGPTPTKPSPPKTAGSSIKGPPNQAPASGSAPSRSPGSSIKGPKSGSSVKLGGKPAGKVAEQSAVASPSGTSGSGLSKPLETMPVLDELPAGGLFDDLLSDAAVLSQPATLQPNLSAGAPHTSPAAKAGKRSRWDSTWFLILVGTLLGLGLVALVVVWRMWSG